MQEREPLRRDAAPRATCLQVEKVGSATSGTFLPCQFRNTYLFAKS